jgi:hypothetical protein
MLPQQREFVALFDRLFERALLDLVALQVNVAEDAQVTLKRPVVL